jgi:hypothetical protein
MVFDKLTPEERTIEKMVKIFIGVIYVHSIVKHQLISSTFIIMDLVLFLGIRESSFTTL